MGDSIVIFLLALMLFGPKKLPQLARQLGKLMAEFRKASNDFRMQMEDELRLEEQKEHQAKVDALAPPPSTEPNPDIPTEDPPHPHLPSTTVEPIAESGELKMMPPSSGLPTESYARGRSYDGDPIPEHRVDGGLPTADAPGAGLSSDNPVEETAAGPPPPPDRSQPAVVGEAERATHV